MATRKSIPSFDKSSSDLTALFEELAPRDPAVAQKKMFGWPSCFVNGNLFTGLHNQSMIFRLPDASRAEFLKLDGAGDFEPMPGRKMKGYAALADPLSHRRSTLETWMRRSLDFARTLPPKQAAPKSKDPRTKDPETKRKKGNKK